MTKLEIFQSIENGENSGVEFIREDTSTEEFAKEIVAFSNLKGGKIFLGVEDKGDISGISRSDKEEWVMNVCRGLVKPGVIPYYEEVKIDEAKKVAVIHIDMGFSKPYCVQRGERKIYYIRVGSTSREATREELARLFQASQAFYYDETAVLNTSFEDLDKDKLTKYFREFRNKDLENMSDTDVNNLLINSGIMKRTDYGEVITVGGLLVFGEEPQKYIPQSSISFACFAGSEITSSLYDKKDINGTILELIEGTVKAIKTNLRTPSEIVGLERVERVFPDEALREAITNAVVHRNYSIGANNRVFMFDDRIEFRSQGSLPNTVTIERMKIGGAFALRNPFLITYLVEFRKMDKLGRGVFMIFQKMAEIGAPEPGLREEGEEFILTLFQPKAK